MPLNMESPREPSISPAKIVNMLVIISSYDGQLMGSINAMKSFTDNHDLPNEASSVTGVGFGQYQVGQMTGSPFT